MIPSIVIVAFLRLSYTLTMFEFFNLLKTTVTAKFAKKNRSIWPAHQVRIMVFQEDIAVFLQMLRKHIKKKVIKIPATLLKYRKMQFVIVSLNKSINISKFEKHCSCVLIETKRPRRSICRGLELIFKLQLHMYVYFLKLSYWDTYTTVHILGDF